MLCLMNVMHSWFCDHTFSLEVSVLSDVKPFRNLTFYNVLAQQGFVIFQAFALRDIKWQPKKAVTCLKSKVVFLSMVMFCDRCFSYFTAALTMYRACKQNYCQ